MKWKKYVISFKILVIFLIHPGICGGAVLSRNLTGKPHDCSSKPCQGQSDQKHLHESRDGELQSIMKLRNLEQGRSSASDIHLESEEDLGEGVHGTKGKRSFQALSVATLGLQVMRGGSRSLIAEKSLEKLLSSIINMHMMKCDIIFINDKYYQGSAILNALVQIPNLRQTILVEELNEIAPEVLWKSSRCQGAFLLLSDGDDIINFLNGHPLLWAFFAKVVVVGLNENSLEKFVETRKGKKTQHIIGIVEGDSEDHFKIFMNLLLYGEGIVQISNWRNGAFTKKTKLFPDKVSNLQNRALKVGVFEWPPAIFYHRDSAGKLLLRYGRDPAVVEALAEIFNFTIEYVQIPDDEIFGYILPNGSFNGLIGYFEKDEGHLGIANLWPAGLDGRNKFQDYSTHFSEDQSCFLARVDPPLPRWQNPGLPFKGETWLAFFISLVLTGPVFYILVIISSWTGLDEDKFKSFEKVNLDTFGVHFSQPLTVLPHNSSMQAFVLFLWLYSLIITTGYTSNLIAFLTFSGQPKGIETIKELYDSGLKIITIPYFVSHFKSADNKYQRALLDRVEIKFTFKEARDEILDGKAVTINSRNYLESFGSLITTSRGKPLVRLMKQCFSSYSVTVGFPVNSPLKPTFNKMIARLFESGLVRIWFLEANKYHEKLVEQEGKREYFRDDWYDSSQGVIPLGMDHTQGIFIIFLVGCFLSTLVFAIEVVSTKKE